VRVLFNCIDPNFVSYFNFLYFYFLFYQHLTSDSKHFAQRFILGSVKPGNFGATSMLMLSTIVTEWKLLYVGKEVDETISARTRIDIVTIYS